MHAFVRFSATCKATTLAAFDRSGKPLRHPKNAVAAFERSGRRNDLASFGMKHRFS
jgi:hypothetical protein